MSTETRTRATRSILTLFFAFSLLFPAFCRATIFKDNFNNYINGAPINGQDDWDIYCVYCPSTSTWYTFDGAVQTNSTRSGYSNFQKTFDPGFTSSTIYVDFKFDGTDPNRFFYIQLFNASNTTACAAESGFIMPVVYNLSYNVWHTLAVNFFLDLDDRPHDRIKIDDGDWSNWNDRGCVIPNGILNFVRIGSLNSGGWDNGIWLDNLTDNTSLLTDPRISTEFPADCEMNGVDFNNIAVSGDIFIPAQNKNTYTDFEVWFQSNTEEIQFFSLNFDIPELSAYGTSTYHYNATTSFATGTYAISYVLLGYDESLRPVSYYQSCGTSYLCPVGETCEPIWFTPTTTTTKPTLDNCDGLSGTDKWLCEIKNTFLGAIVPSDNMVARLKATTEQINGKFPVNYISKTIDFFTTLKNNSQTGQNLQLAILGHAGIVNFSFWNITTPIFGGSVSFGRVLYGFNSFIIALVFLFWAIGFGKRIFR